MGRELQAGDLVQCRFFNTPDNKFYGECWNGELVAISSGEGYFHRIKPYIVERDDGLPTIALHRKEIRHILGDGPERTMFKECWAKRPAGNDYYFNRRYAASLMAEQGFKAEFEKQHGCYKYSIASWEMWKCVHRWAERDHVCWAVGQRDDMGRIVGHRFFTWQDDEGDGMQRAVEFIQGQVD